MKQIAVSGYREIGATTIEVEAIRARLALLYYADPDSWFLLHGNCRGVDRIAAEWCEDNPAYKIHHSGLEYAVTDEEWKRLGRKAGPMRNQRMLENADCLIAFPSPHGSGTQDAIKRAISMNLELHVYWWKP